jgi:cytochrome d ubiquinol oxidase subunit I
MEGALLGNRLAIAISASIHALFATFIVGGMLMGAMTESIGVLTRDDRYERVSHSIARTLVLMSAAVAFMGVVLVLFLTILWPIFWTILFRIMFWPLIFEASMFLGEAACLYSWYYSWGRWPRKVHLLVAWLGAGFAVTAMVMIDTVGSYLLTPRPVEPALQRMLNPSMVQLTLHRFAGNLSWFSFGIAALSAIRYLRTKDPQERAYQEWVGGVAVMFGFGFLLLMPIIGFSYMKAVRFASEGAFSRLMLGEKSWIFVLQALLTNILLLVGTGYMFRMAHFRFTQNPLFRRYRTVAFLLMGGAAIIFMMPYQVRYIPFADLFTSAETNGWGKMQPHKYIAMGVLIGFGILNYGFYLGAFRFKTKWGDGGALPQVLLILLGLFTILSMFNMGYARENGRYPYLIYGKMTIQGEREVGMGGRRSGREGPTGQCRGAPCDRPDLGRIQDSPLQHR